MQQYPKNIKRLLREHKVEAFERELHRELAEGSFCRTGYQCCVSRLCRAGWLPEKS